MTASTRTLATVAALKAAEAEDDQDAAITHQRTTATEEIEITIEAIAFGPADASVDIAHEELTLTHEYIQRAPASSDPEWKYTSVRRYFPAVETSVQEDTDWAVFEPTETEDWLLAETADIPKIDTQPIAGATQIDIPGGALFEEFPEEEDGPQSQPVAETSAQSSVAPGAELFETEEEELQTRPADAEIAQSSVVPGSDLFEVEEEDELQTRPAEAAFDEVAGDGGLDPVIPGGEVMGDGGLDPIDLDAFVFAFEETQPSDMPGFHKVPNLTLKRGVITESQGRVELDPDEAAESGAGGIDRGSNAKSDEYTRVLQQQGRMTVDADVTEADDAFVFTETGNEGSIVPEQASSWDIVNAWPKSYTSGDAGAIDPETDWVSPVDTGLVAADALLIG